MSLVKGKIAENIVADMFYEAGFKVIPLGYEKVTKLADVNNLLVGDAGVFIRHFPDFIVVDEKNEAFLIEVKYRKDGIINLSDIYNFPKANVILLTKDSIYCQSIQKLYAGEEFLTLNLIKPFSLISKDIQIKYLKKTRRLLGTENIFGQLIEKISEKIVGKGFYNFKTIPQVNRDETIKRSTTSNVLDKQINSLKNNLIRTQPIYTPNSHSIRPSTSLQNKRDHKPRFKKLKQLRFSTKRISSQFRSKFKRHSFRYRYKKSR